MEFMNAKMIETYYQQLKMISNKIAKIVILIGILCLITAIPLFIFSNSDSLLLILSIFFASHFIISILVAIIISKTFTSEKPIYKSILPKLVDDIQYNQDFEIKYQAYPKIKEILIDSKLFTKFASNKTRCKLQFDFDQRSVAIYDTHYFTQTEDNNIVHFNGYYTVITKVNVFPIQVRSKGRPARSHGKFTKTVNEKKLKVYCENPNAESNQSVMAIYHDLNKQLQPENLFVSAINQKLYIAIDLDKPKRKIKTLDNDSYAQLKKKWMHLMHSIKESISKNMDE